MNYVIAVVQPPKIEAIRDSLSKIGVLGMTVTDAQGYGRQKGHAAVYHGHEYKINFVRKAKLEIACDESQVEQVIGAITAAAKTGTGAIGDGKIFVFDLKETVRIRTGERGAVAL